MCTNTRAGNAAAANGVKGVLHGDVVVDDDLVDLDAFHIGHIGSHFEVHDIAGVVLDDQQHALAGVDRLDGLKDLVGRGRGEHRASHSAVEHAGADIAAVGGFVAAAAAGNQRDLVALVGAHEHIGAFHALHILGMGLDDAFQHFVDDVFGIVDEFFHGCLSPVKIL